MKKYSIVVRAWQKGAGREGVAFNQAAFTSRLVEPLKLMLKTSNSDLGRIVVVVNADNRFPDFMGEAVGEGGSTPTIRALNEVFGSSIDVLPEVNWGNNAGSATALNTGWRYASQNPEVDQVLSWNPEMALTGHHVARMRDFMYEHHLEICGYLRDGYWERPQFALFQNTAALYLLSTLREVGGFNERCNGNDGETLEIEGLGRVTLAGMDDQDFLLELVKRRGEVPRIGMVGRKNPAPWQTSFPGEPDRQKMFDIKVQRQYAVLGVWAELHLPEMTLREYLGRVFQQMFVGA